MSFASVDVQKQVEILDGIAKKFFDIEGVALITSSKNTFVIGNVAKGGGTSFMVPTREERAQMYAELEAQGMGDFVYDMTFAFSEPLTSFILLKAEGMDINSSWAISPDETQPDEDQYIINIGNKIYLNVRYNRATGKFEEITEA